MNWNYIAGFFDGEGTINKNGYRYRIAITQTNQKVLEEIKTFSKVGNVYEITKRKSHWKDCWIYFISNQNHVYFFLNKIKDKVIVKKDVIDNAILCVKNRLKYRKGQQDGSLKTKQNAKKLRDQGLSYREIGKRLGIDWGYARRIILNLK